MKIHYARCKENSLKLEKEAVITSINEFILPAGNDENYTENDLPADNDETNSKNDFLAEF